MTPLPGIVNVTAGFPKYIPSANAIPNASFLVTDGKQNTSHAIKYAIKSLSDNLPKNSTLSSSFAIVFNCSVNGPFPPIQILKLSSKKAALLTRYSIPLYGTCLPTARHSTLSLYFSLNSTAHFFILSVTFNLSVFIQLGIITHFSLYLDKN